MFEPVLPGNNGRYQSLGIQVAVNAAGKVLFHSLITGATNGATVTAIVRINDPAPGGGLFSILDPEQCALNDAGQVVFPAWVDLQNGGSTADLKGLFLHDPTQGLFSIVREGDQIAGFGQVTSFAFTGGMGLVGLGNSGFNSQGQVAFRCLAGVKEGIVLWGFPPPVTISSVALTSGGLAISWPATITDAIVETTTNLASPGSWSPSGVTPALSNDVYHATLPIIGMRATSG